MDSHRLDPPIDRAPSRAAGLRFGLAGLSLRLAALRQAIERDYPMTLAVDIANRDAVDGLPPDLTDTLHALIEMAAIHAARDAHAATMRLSLQLKGGLVVLCISEDGNCLASSGRHDLAELAAQEIGPRGLVERVAALGGTMTLESRPGRTHIDIALPREVMAQSSLADDRTAAA